MKEHCRSLLPVSVSVAGGKKDSSSVQVEVYDERNQLVSKGNLNAGKGDLTIGDTHLWQPLHAYLYSIHVIMDSEDGRDVYELPYGVRSVRVEGQKFLREELDKWAAINKPVVFTEYGADTIDGLHDTTPVMYTEEYQVEFYEMYSRVFEDYPCVTGEQVWNFATSQSLSRIQGNRKGIFTRDRKPKLAAHYLRHRWTSIPDYDY